MLRTSLLQGRRLAAGARRLPNEVQWRTGRHGGLAGDGKVSSPSDSVFGANFQQRLFADVRKPDETVLPGSSTVLPGSSSRIAGNNVPDPPSLPATPLTPSSTTVIPPESVPRAPPSPDQVNATIPPSTVRSPPDPAFSPLKRASPAANSPADSPPATAPPVTRPPAVAPPPPPPRRKPRRFRRFLLTLLLVLGLGYGGGVYYSLLSDNFHDFFTEYVPFAEDAVGYFEEREFRKRFPNTVGPRAHTENKITIPSKSGIRSRISADDKNPVIESTSSKGRHVSALEDNKPTQAPVKNTPMERKNAVEEAKKAVAQEAEKKASESKSLQQPAKDEIKMGKNVEEPKVVKVEEKPKANPAKEESPKPAPPPQPKPKPPPAPPIDHIQVPNAEEPVVQEVVKMLNDIITVVNADNASDKYSSTISKAREDLGKVISDVAAIKATEQQSAAEKLRATHVEFDHAAKELVRRLEGEMRDQEARWREEYEAEREKLAQGYQEKLKTELESAQAIYEQRLKNELLERSIQLSRQLASTVSDRVEAERSGRLSKLSELDESVKELERLTAEWNNVVDATLSTQHLHVALDAVTSKLAQADRPVSFVGELAALKEVSNSDPVVSAAIASIPPPAYQRGVPTPAQLMDRFRGVATEVRKAALVPEHAGVGSHVASWALSKLMLRKEGVPVGDDVESILTRTERWLEEGDLEAAAREVTALNGWAKVLANDWLKDVRKVCEVRQALDVIATEARLQSLLVD